MFKYMPAEKYMEIIHLLKEVARDYPMDETYGTNKEGDPSHYWGMTNLECFVRTTAWNLERAEKDVHPARRRGGETLEEWRKRQ